MAALLIGAVVVAVALTMVAGARIPPPRPHADPVMPPRRVDPTAPSTGSPAVAMTSPTSLQLPSPPLDKASPAVTDQPSAAPSIAISATTGPGCAATSTAGYYAAYPAGSPVGTVTAGGWRGPGCDGSFWTVPMSGSASADDPGTYVMWWFGTAPVTHGQCSIATYVPDGVRAGDGAGDPAVYQVLRARDVAEVVGGFSVHQPTHRGSWVDGGVFPVQGGQIAVKLLDRGSGAGGARLAAAQVRVSCVRG